jgi:hypothetical protein
MPGAAHCVANLAIIKKRLNAESKKAVKTWGKGTIELSKNRYCPRDTGRLASTGKMEISKNTQTEFFVRLSYNTPYANRQHETPWYHHPVGQWKYLSTPFNYRAALFTNMVEAAWRKVL